jgi:hypothetical protein
MGAITLLMNDWRGFGHTTFPESHPIPGWDGVQKKTLKMNSRKRFSPPAIGSHPSQQ